MDASALLSKLRAGGRDALARRFGIDARALAALRISLGVLLLADLALRSRHLVAFYTDAGVLPTAVLREQAPGLARLSLHALSGAAWVQVALFLIAAAFALALLVGYRTTPVAVASWVLLVSLHARNPVVLNAGDSILRRLLFWGLFLPLGHRWSIDALRRGGVRGNASDRRDADSGPRVASAASAALLFQVVIIYAVNAAFKLRVGRSWESGEAIRYVFSLDRLTVLLGDYLAQYPTLLGFADRVWLGLLVTSVLLVVLTGRARAAFASLFVGMHLGMALTMRLGIFPLVSAAALLAFLPPSVWDAVERRASPRVRRLVDATGLGGRF
ncbi:HTTM domain-containing protein, partial [Halorussus sp. GCM10023401]